MAVTLEHKIFLVQDYYCSGNIIDGVCIYFGSELHRRILSFVSFWIEVFPETGSI